MLYYLVSPAGIPNYGDELIAMTWLRYLNEVAPEAEVVVDCMGPDAASGGMRGLHPRTTFVNVLWSACMRNWSADARVTADAVAAEIGGPGGDLLRRANVVHVVGGGFVNGIWAPFAGLFAGVVAATRASGALAAMTGQGLCPPDAASADLIRSLVGQFQIVDVRDRPSAEFLASPVVSGDDVFLGLDAAFYDPDPDLPEVMVSVQSLTSDVEPARVVGCVAAMLASWDVSSVGLVECAPDQDRDVLALAGRMLPVARTFSLPEILKAGFPARAGQTWITTRFHPHLVAAAAGAAGVALCVQPEYYATKHRSLIDGGSSWLMPDGFETVARPCSGGYSTADLAHLRAAKRAVASRIYPA